MILTEIDSETWLTNPAEFYHQGVMEGEKEKGLREGRVGKGGFYGGRREERTWRWEGKELRKERGKGEEEKR